MWNIPLAISLAAVLTLVLAYVDVSQESKILTWPTGPMLAYAVLLLIGTAVATMLAWPLIVDRFGSRNSLVIQTLVPFIGVFGAQVIVRNMGVTLFGKNLLTFDIWVQRARDYAVESQLRSEAARATKKDIAIARKLAIQEDLTTCALHVLGDGAVTKHEERAEKNKADPKMSMAMAVVEENRDAAIAFLSKKPHRRC